MFRIRESYVDQKTVCIGVDGRLSDGALEPLRDTLEKYLDLNFRIILNLTHLNQVGWEGKRLLKEIRDRVVLVDLPEYLKTEIMGGDRNDSDEQ